MVAAQMGVALAAKGVSQDRLVGVGNSGTELCEMIAGRKVPNVDVRTTNYKRERSERSLEVGEIPNVSAPVLIDDIAVSGLTLGQVVGNFKQAGRPTEAAVGFSMKSKRMRRLIGLGESFSSLVTYSLEGGGSPPINSISSLRSFPDRRDELIEKYFSSVNDEFEQLIEEMK